MVELWEPGTQYNQGAIVEYNRHKYKIIQPHRSQGDWTPDVTPALWGRLQDADDGHGHESQHHQQHQPQQQHQQQQQQPYQRPPQPYQQQQEHHSTPPAQQQEEHWWQNEHNKKEAEIAGGVLAGVLALGAGYAAYKHHENSEEKKKVHAETFDRWVAEAQGRTERYRREGPPGRVWWELVRGTRIPDNAIEGGREASGQILFIARAFIDGGLQIGKACISFGKGANIGYGHKEHELDTYEILVGDGSAVRWVDFEELKRSGFSTVEGGVENNGTKLFIAQASHHGGFHPGKCGGDFHGAFIAFGGTEVKIDRYKVLVYA